MTPAEVALVKIIIAAVLIYGICKLETSLEKKLSEPYGTRTDILILGSLFLVVVSVAYIFYQAWIICAPLFSIIFKIPM